MGEAREGAEGAVVVGIDGSEHADAALRYAITEAARRGSRVVAVVAWGPGNLFGGYGMLEDPGVVEPRLREQAEAHIRWVHQAMGASKVPVSEVPVELDFSVGKAAEVLVDAARSASLLVVGHRGRGAVRSTLLGSVGLSCVMRAPCPVVVVPGVGGAGEDPEVENDPSSRP